MHRTAILLTVLVIFPSVLCRHIGRTSSEDESESNSDVLNVSSGSKRQLRKTSLRLHVKPPRTLHVREGAAEFLECQAGGTPAPAIHWLKDGVIISKNMASPEQPSESSSSAEEDGGRRKIHVSFTSSRLYLDCLSVEDEGEYSCVAENPYQRISTSTQLTVSSSDDEVDCEKKTHGQAPRVTEWTRTMIGSQGEPARLTCRADGYPRPTLRWLGPSDQELTKADFSKYEVLPDGDLIIRSMTWTDMGTYKCVAENVHGEATVDVFVYPAVPDT